MAAQGLLIDTPPFVAGPTSVDGSVEQPYRICTYEQFAYIATDATLLPALLMGRRKRGEEGATRT